MNFTWLGFGTTGSAPNLKLLLVACNRMSLEVVKSARVTNRTLLGNTLLLTLRRMNYGVCVNGGIHERIPGYFGRIDELVGGEDRSSV